MSRFAASATAGLALLLASCGNAIADPVVPQQGSACGTDLADAMTLTPGDQTPVVCRDGQWQTAPNPYPPSERWLSYGVPITLHGEGLRNPSLRSGAWTATPLADSACSAEQSVVLAPGVVGEPETTSGEPGRPLDLQVRPRLYSIELGGNCLWEKADGS